LRAQATPCVQRHVGRCSVYLCLPTSICKGVALESTLHIWFSNQTDRCLNYQMSK
uniref:Uncharacterized protein n=1 Tax=Buteo japonicus TaxID=224669 RepID=A0A8C0BGK7_9AVES